MIAWENVVCPVCAARDEEEILRVPSVDDAVEYRLVRCRACDLGYVNPRPDAASIVQFYPAEYESYEVPQVARDRWWQSARRGLERWVMARYYDDPPKLEHWYEHVLAAVARPWLAPSRDSLTALPFQGQGRLLDYGCGNGWYAERMRQRGWTVTGMDFSPHAAAQVHKHFGIGVIVGTIPHPQIAPESLDVITMSNVLEHVHAPRELIHAAAQALRPGGLLAVAVPNRDSWGFRHFGCDWWGLQLPLHLSHFTPATLRRLVNSAGLVVRQVRLVAHAGWVRRSLSQARRVSGLGRLARLRLLSGLVARWTAWTHQADCILLTACRPVTTLLPRSAHAA
jgi:2-polyprenyl-3-methyl-5-hydroxy-6-metoxy-1,4-benzoquinol methylase